MISVSNKKSLPLLVLVTLAIFAGCFFIALFGLKQFNSLQKKNSAATVATIEKSSAPSSFPNLLATGTEGVYTLTYDPAQKKYIESAELYAEDTYRSSAPPAVIPAEGGYYLISRGIITLRSYDGRELASWGERRQEGGVFDLRAAMVHEQYVMLYSELEHAFVVLDLDLKEVGRYTFTSQELGSNDFIEKGVDDILVHGSTALLVDDIIYPIYIFSFDISDIKKPRKLQTYKFFGTYPHISHQWINPSDGTWFLASSEGGQYGGSESLVRIPKNDYLGPSSGAPVSPKDVTNIASTVRNSNSYVHSGYSLTGELDSTESWFTTQDIQTKKVTLTKLDPKTFEHRNAVELTEKVALQGRSGNLLFLLGVEALQVIDVSSATPQLVLTQDVPQVPDTKNRPKHPKWYTIETTD